jgi:hypothetical protein
VNRTHAATLAIPVILLLTAGCADATEPPAAAGPPVAAPPTTAPAPTTTAPAPTTPPTAAFGSGVLPRAARGPGVTSTPTEPAIEASGALSGVSPSGSGGVVVVPIEESDAVHIAAGGRVVAVAPSAVAVSGVTSYYVTVALTGGDPRLRAGQTAVVTVPAG